jgi:hypothetical protein
MRLPACRAPRADRREGPAVAAARSGRLEQRKAGQLAQGFGRVHRRVAVEDRQPLEPDGAAGRDGRRAGVIDAASTTTVREGGHAGHYQRAAVAGDDAGRRLSGWGGCTCVLGTSASRSARGRPDR